MRQGKKSEQKPEPKKKKKEINPRFKSKFVPRDQVLMSIFVKPLLQWPPPIPRDLLRGIRVSIFVFIGIMVTL